MRELGGKGQAPRCVTQQLSVCRVFICCHLLLEVPVGGSEKSVLKEKRLTRETIREAALLWVLMFPPFRKYLNLA